MGGFGARMLRLGGTTEQKHLGLSTEDGANN